MDRPHRIGKYEVISQIASGGFGVVYKGWDPFIKRAVAIKLCLTPDEEVRKRFQQEAQFVGNLVHRNITLVFDFGVEDGVPYIVQEYLTGFDLDQLAAAGTLNEPRSVVAILLQVCEALDFAHRRGIIHRDIKPANIRVLEDGTVKILDFGIAKSQEAGLKLTQTGIALGTAGYLAPEQIQGGTIDARTDIFALGVVAYELITGVRPFQGNSLSNVLFKILHEDPPTPVLVNPSCNPELDRLITRAMAKDPDDRFPSAAELYDALRAIAAAEIAEGEPARESTTGILRDAVNRMDSPATPPVSGESTTAGIARPPRSTRPAHAQIEHPPRVGDADQPRRRPALATFLMLLALIVLGAGALYFSEDAQRIVFGARAAPWVPTPTPTATPTPEPTATPTPHPRPDPVAGDRADRRRSTCLVARRRAAIRQRPRHRRRDAAPPRLPHLHSEPSRLPRAHHRPRRDAGTPRRYRSPSRSACSRSWSILRARPRAASPSLTAASSARCPSCASRCPPASTFSPCAGLAWTPNTRG